MSDAVMTLRDDIRHDWTVEEIRAIHDGPLMDLVFPGGDDPSPLQTTPPTSSGPPSCRSRPAGARRIAATARNPPTTRRPASPASYDAGGDRAERGRGRQGGRRDPLLHGRRVAPAEGRAGIRFRARHGAGRARPRDGSCVTLGMLTDSQAERLAEAGLTAYNHNLDTGPGYYDKVVSTRTYDDRLATLDRVRAAGIGVCCGGIIGIGEEVHDRVRCCTSSPTMPPTPESVPINALRPRRRHAARRWASPVDPSTWCACAPPPASDAPLAGAFSAADGLSAARRRLLCFSRGRTRFLRRATAHPRPMPARMRMQALLAELGVPVAEPVLAAAE